MDSADTEKKVWLDMSQAALDAAYDQTVYAPNFAEIIGRMTAASASLAERLPAPVVLQYGPSEIERIFYFRPKNADVPIHVHVHGGAWHQRPAKSIFFPAEMFVSAGIGFAIFDFISVDETHGDLRPMAEQVTRALAWLASHASELGGDRDRLHLSGFSSGAHLASVAIIADWHEFGFDRMPYRNALLASGIYDLRAVRLSKRSEYVRFTDEIEASMSARRHIDRFDIPVKLAYGTCETPEFQRQTREFAQQLKEAGRDAELLTCPGSNHYEMMEMFGHPYSLLGRAALVQIWAG